MIRASWATNPVSDEVWDVAAKYFDQKELAALVLNIAITTAHLDEGTMWPTAFALTKLTADNEARIGALVKKAAN